MIITRHVISATERAPCVLIAASPFAVLVVLAALLLSGCDRGNVEKLEAENAALKTELEKVRAQVGELASKQKQEAALREQEEVKRKQELAEQHLVEVAQKQAAAELEQKAKAEQERKDRAEREARRVQAVEKCLDKLQLRMNALLETPRKYPWNDREERRQAQTKLETIANTKKEEMGEILIELDSLGVKGLRDTIDSFIRAYGMVVHSERLSADYYSFDKPASSEASDRAKNYLATAQKYISSIEATKREATSKISDP